jgi:hypothetical protein
MKSLLGKGSASILLATAGFQPAHLQSSGRMPEPTNRMLATAGFQPAHLQSSGRMPERTSRMLALPFKRGGSCRLLPRISG